MKATHICTFKDSENIITEIIVTSQSKTRHFPKTLFHYLDPNGIGSCKAAVHYLKMTERKNGKWQKSSMPAVTSYWRNN